MKKPLNLLFKYLCLCSALSASFSQLRAADYFIDSSVGSDDCADGLTLESAWQSLDYVNAHVFQPGDTLNFRRGGVWFGQLKPQGSGLENLPIVIRSYGEGELPLIDGNGVTGEAVVYLHNQEYWEITELEIVNTASEEGDRRGIWISASNYGVINHIHIKDLYIHDIYGVAGQSLEAKKTGGIYIAVTDDTEVPTRWNDIRIENCVIHDVRNSGLTIQNETIQDRFNFPPSDPDWEARRVTNLYVGNNTIYNVAKNAMIIRLADGGVVEFNLVHNTAIGGDGQGLTGNSIFSRSARNTIFQFNEGFANRSPDFDGSLYDADLNSPGTIWQYSYSHDNAHGLYWGCTVKQDDGIIVRYNISQNDRGVIFCINYPVTGTSIYNNTVYIGPHRSPTIIGERGKGGKGTRNYDFRNNLIYSLSDSASYSFNTEKGKTYNRIIERNLFFGVEPPEYSVAHVTEDPLLRMPGSGLAAVDFNDLNRLKGYELKPGSPAIDAGLFIEGNGGRDFWGNALTSDIPDLGAHEFVEAH